MKTQRLELPFPPPLSACFTNKKYGKGRVKTARYRAFENEAGQMLMAQHTRSMKPPYHVDLYFRAPDKRKRDADNLKKATFDVLVKNGIIEDDNNHCIHSGTWQWVDEGPPLMVAITSI